MGSGEISQISPYDKTVVFGLDGTIVSVSVTMAGSGEMELDVTVRPGLESLLQVLSSDFELILWSSSEKQYT